MDKFIKLADHLGMASAMLCGLHCTAIPLLVVAAPLFSWLDMGEQVHLYLALFAVVPVLVGLLPGYLVHRRQEVILLSMSGLFFLVGAVWVAGPAYGELAESVLTLMGAALLFSAHLKNRRCCALCL